MCSLKQIIRIQIKEKQSKQKVGEICGIADF